VLLQTVSIHITRSLKINFTALPRVPLSPTCVQLKCGMQDGAIAQFPGMFHQKQAYLSPSDIHMLAVDFLVLSV